MSHNILRFNITLALALCCACALITTPARATTELDPWATTVHTSGETRDPGAPHPASGLTPIEIHSVADLNTVRNDLSASYILMADLDLAGAPFEPIGAPATPFTGIFNGNDHSISGFNYNAFTTLRNDVGLFSVLSGAIIDDLHLVNVNIGGWIRAGALAGQANNITHINNCSVQGTMTVGLDEGGGLVGMTNLAKVQNCTADMTITDPLGASFRTGALIGHAHYGSRIFNCTATGSITAHDVTGGLLGALHGSIVLDSTSSVSVSGDGWTGGFVGYVKFETGWDTQILSCAALDPGHVECRGLGNRVNHAEGTGGLAGYLERDCFIYDSDANVEVTGFVPTGIGEVTNSGGLVGFQEGESRLTNCYASGSVTGFDCGGLVGWCTGEIFDCYATGDVSGAGFCGGLAGNIEGAGRFGGFILRSYATGNVYAGPNENGHADPIEHPFAAAGGLVGYAFPGCRIMDCFATGDVEGDGQYTGGLVGFFWDCRVWRSCAMGNVLSSGKKAGGLIGGVQEVGGEFGLVVEIEDCFATGDVNIINERPAFVGDAGGLIGSVVTDGAEWTFIRRCYAAGCVMVNAETAGGLVGQFVGCNGARTSIEDCVWDTDSTLQPESASICQGRMAASRRGGDNPPDEDPLDNFADEVIFTTIRPAGLARSASEMASDVTFRLLGWDLDDTWVLEPGAPYPVLRHLPPEIRQLAR